jgi:hypothetical protein
VESGGCVSDTVPPANLATCSVARPPLGWRGTADEDAEEGCEEVSDEADDEEALAGAPCAPPSTRRRSHPAFAHLSSFALTLRPLRLCGEVQRTVLVSVAHCTSPQRRKGRKVKAKEDSSGSNGALRGFCG